MRAIRKQCLKENLAKSHCNLTSRAKELAPYTDRPTHPYTTQPTNQPTRRATRKLPIHGLPMKDPQAVWSDMEKQTCGGISLIPMISIVLGVIPLISRFFTKTHTTLHNTHDATRYPVPMSSTTTCTTNAVAIAIPIHHRLSLASVVSVSPPVPSPTVFLVISVPRPIPVPFLISVPLVMRISMMMRRRMVSVMA
jgi:hypothetical protein